MRVYEHYQTRAKKPFNRFMDVSPCCKFALWRKRRSFPPLLVHTKMFQLPSLLHNVFLFSRNHFLFLSICNFKVKPQQSLFKMQILSRVNCLFTLSAKHLPVLKSDPVWATDKNVHVQESSCIKSFYLNEYLLFKCLDEFVQENIA